MIRWCSWRRGVEVVSTKATSHQIGRVAEHADLGADEAGPAAALIDIERVLSVGIARIDAVEIVREFAARHDDRHRGDGGGRRQRRRAPSQPVTTPPAAIVSVERETDQPVVEDEPACRP